MQEQPRFQGILTAIVTPFLQNEAVDEEALRRLVERQIENGVHGIVACGSTGETPVLEDHEQLLVVKTCIETTHGRIPIIAGAGSNNTKRACMLQRQMSELGVAATLQVTPWYNKPTQEGLYRHFRAIAESSPTPVILYNVPCRTGIDISSQTILRLAKDCPSIVGIKDADNVDVLRVQTYIHELHDLRPDFAVLSGEDIFVLPLLAMGGHGVISVGSNVMPKEFVSMYNAFLRGDLGLAQRLAGELAALTSLMFFRTNPIPAKTALSMMNLMAKTFRLPLCELSTEDEEFLRVGLKKLRII